MRTSWCRAYAPTSKRIAFLRVRLQSFAHKILACAGAVEKKILPSPADRAYQPAMAELVISTCARSRGDQTVTIFGTHAPDAMADDSVSP
jgi:hypothetical protein